ncbi:MAG: hypothetical protein MI757_13345 [Pirellulales bacterium]|nr:hypothetical protein [Pirellulales bacterium]
MKLREPWQRETRDDCVEFRRAFNRPSNLEPHERVYVSIRSPKETGRVAVNGAALGEMSTESEAAFDVTRILEDHNHLVITLAATTDTTALPFDETAIEIRTDS